MRRLSCAWIIVAAACTPAGPAPTPIAPPLKPYATITPSATPDPLLAMVVSAETPLPSPTPSQYTIRAGDTLSQIAERYRITLDALLLANPDIDPNTLSVGETVRIPASPVDFAGEATPTPVPFPIQQVVCHPTANSALWCFVLVHNNTPDMIENITAQVTLVDATGAAIDSKTALLPLDILPPGASLPLSVFFAPPVDLDARPRVQILTAIRLLPGDRRYLAARVGSTVTQISWMGRSAELRGEVFLPEAGVSAASIWLAAVAYDESGRIVGWRRWESTDGLAAGSSVSFELLLSSLAGRIHQVDLVVQARP